MKDTENRSHSGKKRSPGKKRNAWLVWTLRLPLFVLLGVVLLVGILMTALQLRPVQDRLRDALEKSLSSQLGVILHIEHIGGNFLSDIALEGISLKGPDNAPILSVDRLSADYILPMALMKIIHLREIAIDGLQLDLTKSDAGQWNLPSFPGAGADTSPEKGSPSPFRFHIAEILITDTRVNIREPGMDAAVSLLDIFRLSATLDVDDSVTLSILDSDISLHRPETFPLALSGRVSFETQTSTVELGRFGVDVGTSRIVLDGSCRFEDPMPVFSVAIDAENIDLQEISDIFSLSDLPESTASGTLAFSGTPGNFKNDVSISVGDAVFRLSGTTGLDDSRGLWTDVTGGIEGLDLFRQGLSFSDVLSGIISADISFRGDHLLSPSQGVSTTSASLQGLSIDGIPLDALQVAADSSGRTFSIRRLEAVSGQNRLDLSGTIDLEALNCNLDIIADLPHPSSLLEPFSVRSSQPPFALGGETHITASLAGWFDRPSLRFSVDTRGITVKQHHAEALLVSGVWEGLPGPDSRVENIDIYIHGLAGEFLQSDTLSLTGDWRGWIDAPVFDVSVISSDVTLLSYHADRLEIDGIWKGLPGPQNRIEDLAISLKGLGGDLLQADALSVKGSWHGWLNDPVTTFIAEAAGMSAQRLQVDVLNISGNLQGKPNDENALARLTLGADGVRFDQIEAGRLTFSADGRGPYSGFSGETSLEISQVSLYGQRFNDISLTGHIQPEEAVFRVLGDHEGGSSFEIGGNVASWKAAPHHMTLDTLSIITTDPWPSAALSIRSPLRFSLSKDLLHIESCLLQLNDAVLALGGQSAGGGLGFDLAIDNLELGNIPGSWNESARLSGTASLASTIGGSLTHPVISSQLDVKDLSGYGISHTTDFSAALDYSGTMASFQAELSKEASLILSATGSIPFELSLNPFSLRSDGENMTASLRTQDLRFSDLPIPPVKGIEWDAVASMDLQLSGALDAPDLSGKLTIRDGNITLVKNKLTYESITADLSMSNDSIVVDRMEIAGDQEGRLTVGGTVYLKKDMPVIADLTLNGKNFYIPFQKAISARISPDLHLSGSIARPKLSGKVTISESRINLDQLSRSPRSDIQIVESTDSENGSTMLVASRPQPSDLLSSFSADISVHVPRNAWLRGQDVTAEIAGDLTIRKEPGGSFILLGPLTILRGNYYFMRKNFRLTEGNVEFLGLPEINPNLNIETETRIKSVTIIATLHGSAQELMVDLSSDPAMDESDIISYLVFGRATSDLSGNQAFSVEKSALSYTGTLLATELRTLLGDVSFIDTFSIESGSDDRSFGAVTLGKYITPEIFISHRQGLSENEPSYQEITYELTPQIKLETQIGRDQTSSADLTWEFDF